MEYCKNPELENIYEISRFLSEEADFSLVIASKDGKVFLSMSHDSAPQLVLNLTQAMCCNEELARIINDAYENFRSPVSRGLHKNFLKPNTWEAKHGGVSSSMNVD